MRPTLALPLLVVGCLCLLAMQCFEELYPGDQCVAVKLGAAAQLCEALVRGDSADFEGFREAWADAEALAAAEGVDCGETTGPSGSMELLVTSAAASIADAVGSDEGASCPTQLDAAARLCLGLVGARSAHLVQRSGDRDRSGLAGRIADAEARHAEQHGRGGEAACGDVESVREATRSAADLIVEHAIVSPNASSEWTLVEFERGEEVPYEGRTWLPSCWDGEPYRLYYKRGTVNKLMMYYQGGGACWDYFTCSAPTFKTTADDSDDPSLFSSGFVDFENPDNPFRDWHWVVVPYCTGDVHWGDNDVTYEAEANGMLQSIDVLHRGFHNTRVAEKLARERFVDPEQVFVTGSSAGAYGAIANSAWLMERVYPSADTAVLGDAGNGVIPQDFLSIDIANWNIETVLPDWIPELNVPVTELDAADLYIAAANTYPRNRIGTYTTAFDGSQGGQTGFYNVMLNPVRSAADAQNILLWRSWWNASCAWNAGMRALNAKAETEAPLNYRSYVGPGSRHTMWGSDKVYDETVGGVPTIVSWIEAMLAGSPDWVSRECTDCGLLRPEDPAPSPPELPFTQVGTDVVIDCPGTP